MLYRNQVLNTLYIICDIIGRIHQTITSTFSLTMTYIVMQLIMAIWKNNRIIISSILIPIALKSSIYRQSFGIYSDFTYCDSITPHFCKKCKKYIFLAVSENILRLSTRFCQKLKSILVVFLQIVHWKLVGKRDYQWSGVLVSITEKRGLLYV